MCEETKIDEMAFSRVTKIYNILKPLNLKNDVIIFINTYEMMLSCKEGMEKVEGWAKDTLKYEVIKLIRELERLRIHNYAVKQALQLNKC